ncbi:hypothetical protein ACIRP0_22045 [Streptomyces sp. NPDC101733]|uniref:hypothetical protein n=1 Tax=unclassified Streptomyces TaxID=2593676 RepID=UPI0038148F12
MTDAANTPPTTRAARAARVITIVAVVISVAYTGLWTVISVPQLTELVIGLGSGLSKTGWAAGLAGTGILATLTFGYLLDSSAGHGFASWMFLALIVAATLGAFSVTPYALVRGAAGRRRPSGPGPRAAHGLGL